MTKDMPFPQQFSPDSEMDSVNKSGMSSKHNDLILSAKALLRAHNKRNGSDGSIDTRCMGESPPVLSPPSLSRQSSRQNENIPHLQKKSSKEPKKQKEVVMSYKINCVSDISAILCTVEVDLKVFFHWCDEALIGRKNGTTIIAGEEKGLFDPDIVISNEHNISEVSSVAKVTNSETGEVKCSKHYKGTVFLTSMDLRLFPFDCQNLQICFKPYKKSIDEVIMIRSDPAECAMESRIAHEWDILGHCMKVFETDPLTSSTKKVYSTIYLTVLTRRKAGWFVANIFVPTFLMLVVSWLTFIYEPHGARSDRNDVSMSTLLLSISNKFVVGDAMPKVDYRTLVDIYVDTCFYLQVLTMLANAVVEKYQDVPFLGTFGRHLNLSFFLLELVAAFCLHEWFFVSLWNHRADILDWVEASKNNDMDTDAVSEASEPIAEVVDKGNRSRLNQRSDSLTTYLNTNRNVNTSTNVGSALDSSTISSATPPSLTSMSKMPILPSEHNGAESASPGIAFEEPLFKFALGVRRRRSSSTYSSTHALAHLQREEEGEGEGMREGDNETRPSSGLFTPERMEGNEVPTLSEFRSSSVSPLQVDFDTPTPSTNGACSPLSPLLQGIMHKGVSLKPLQREAQHSSSTFASSTSSFFTTTGARLHKKTRYNKNSSDMLSPLVARQGSKEAYKTRPRRVSSVATLLGIIERVTGPSSLWTNSRLNSPPGSGSSAEEGSVRRLSSPHFTDFGASGVTPVSHSSTVSINEARRLQSNMHIERANVVSEMFKRTASRANLREALAQRRERKIEREKKNEHFEADLKPVRGISSNSYFGSGNREEKEVSASDLHYATWEEKEEAEILNMAAKVLQQRWRYTRARRQLLVLNNLRDQALLEGYACRIQRTFRLRRVLKTIRQNREKLAAQNREKK